jgi:predicted dehydrogenase
LRDFNILNALKSEKAWALFKKRADGSTVCGGHAFAAGFELAIDNILSVDGYNLTAQQTAAEEKIIKVAIIGCGSVSNRYIVHLQSSPLVKIVSLCDIKQDRAEAQNKKYNIGASTYNNINALLKGNAFDLMLTLTDMQMHGALNKIALGAGKNVWSEKPLANTYAEGKALVDYAKLKGVRIWGAPAVVTSPQFEFMSKTIQAGKLGKLASAHGQYGHTGPTWSSFFYEPLGGSMPDLGVYNMATLTGLLGPAKSVMAMTSIVNKPIRNITVRRTPKCLSLESLPR